MSVDSIRFPVIDDSMYAFVYKYDGDEAHDWPSTHPMTLYPGKLVHARFRDLASIVMSACQCRKIGCRVSIYGFGGVLFRVNFSAVGLLSVRPWAPPKFIEADRVRYDGTGPWRVGNVAWRESVGQWRYDLTSGHGNVCEDELTLVEE